MPGGTAPLPNPVADPLKSLTSMARLPNLPWLHFLLQVPVTYRLLEQEDFTWTRTMGKLDMYCTLSVRSPSQTEPLDGNEEF